MARLASIPHRFAAIFVLVALGAVGFLPLFGGPGYEQSLATGLLVPAATAIAIALEGVRSETRTPLALVARGVLLGLALAGLSLLTALLHAARVGICEVWGALFYFLITAGAGSVRSKESFGSKSSNSSICRARSGWPFLRPKKARCDESLLSWCSFMALWMPRFRASSQQKSEWRGTW